MAAPTLTPPDQDRLIREHMRFARHLARKHAWDAESLEEATSDAYVGLVQAAQRYNSAAGTVFSTYAGLRIVGAIRDGQRCRDRLPRSTRRQITAGGPAPAWAQPPIGLDALLLPSQSSDGTEFEVELAIAHTPDPCEALSLKEAIRALGPRDRQVLELHHGGWEGREIAALLGVTESAISHRLRRIRDRLRAEIAEAA